MYIVAIAWIYVVLMMALAEALSSQGSLLGAAVTLVLYGLLPMSIVLYLMGTPHRWRARRAAEAAELAALRHAGETAAAAEGAKGTEETGRAGAAVAGSPGLPPDGGGQPAGDAVAPVRKEA